MIRRRLGLVDYEPTWQAMRAFTTARTVDTADELWLCQHRPIFTLGLAGKAEHLLRDIGIETLKVDRGGQVTYHGPGQAVVYLLLDLRRRQLTVKDLVRRMEQAVIDLLAERGIVGERWDGAPGVYVGAAKLAALGLKIRNGCCYHGLSLNVSMDLAPFAAINPCGYPGLIVTQLADLSGETDPEAIGGQLAAHLERLL